LTDTYMLIFQGAMPFRDTGIVAISTNDGAPPWVSREKLGSGLIESLREFIHD
jgi:hypothetical protein